MEDAQPASLSTKPAPPPGNNEHGRGHRYGVKSQQMLNKPPIFHTAGFPQAVHSSAQQGTKMTFQDLAKAAQQGRPGVPPINAQQPPPMPAKVMSLAELEMQISGGATRPSGEAAAGPPGFSRDAKASQMLMGMLRKAAPASDGGPASAHSLPLNVPPPSAPPAPVEAGTARPAGLPPVSSFGSYGGIWGAAAPAAQQQPPPGLSSIWGAAASDAVQVAPQHQPSAALPQVTSTQAAAASLFEHLSNAAAAGTGARPPPPGGFPAPMGAAGQQAATPNPLMALFAKAAAAGQQQQQQPAGATSGPSVSQLADDTLNSMLKDLGIGPEPSARPQEQQGQGAPPKAALQGLFAGAGAGGGGQAPPTQFQMQMQQLMMQQQQQQQQQRPALNYQDALQMQMRLQQMQQAQQMQQQQGMRPPAQPQQQQQQQAGASGFNPHVMQQLQQMQMQQQAAMKALQQQQQYQQYMQFQQQQQRAPQGDSDHGNMARFFNAPPGPPPS